MTILLLLLQNYSLLKSKIKKDTGLEPMAFAENTILHESLNTADLRNNSDITGKQRDNIARMKADKKSTIMYLIECDLPKQITQKKNQRKYRRK